MAIAVRQLAGLGPRWRPRSSSTPRETMTVARVLDAGDQVAVARDHVAGAPAVPGHAVIEDVAEAVPLGGALQRHRDHVVGAADAVREALGAALRVGAGVGHRVHRVGAPAPAALRAVRVEGLRERDDPARLTRAAASHALGLVDEVQRAEHVVLAPAAPVAVSARRARRSRLRGRCGRGASSRGSLGRAAVMMPPTQRTTCVPSPSIEPVMTSPSRRNRFQCWPLPGGSREQQVAGQQRHGLRRARDQGRDVEQRSSVVGPASPRR